ncbi:hypothetical protein Tco_0340265 [Tanacetum coccineum]
MDSCNGEDNYDKSSGKTSTPYYSGTPIITSSDEEIEGDPKGKTKVDEDLSKPFKEVLKCPFTRRISEFSSPGHRMPANAKIYDGTGDPEDHVGRFVGMRNQGEWPMPLEIALESGKLNHLIKDVRQRGRAVQRNNGPQKAKAPSPYNIILGRPGLKQLRAIPSTIHGMMKFPTPWGIATLVSQAPIIFECRREGKKQAVEQSEETKSQEKVSLTEHVLVNPAYPEQLVVIGKGLSPEGIVRPVKYLTWISNPVLVKKVNGSWRMCINFKNINSACPKDYYLFPEINGKIESVVGFPLKCFLYAYKGYHQVQMAEEDEEKITFYTSQGIYCYTKMPFGLKNAGATYQRRMNMKLNPKKCSFGVEEGKFLGYMVTSEGIRANPAKTKDIAEMQSPKTWGDMQSLARKLAALNREGIKRFLRTQKDYLRPTGAYNPTIEGNFVRIPSGLERSSQCSATGGKVRKAMSSTLRQLCHSGNPHGSMQHASKGKVGGRAGYTTGVLFANDALGREGRDTQV